MKTYNNTLSNINRAFSLFLQGFIFGSRSARSEFGRVYFRPWLNSLGGVGAWIATILACVAVFAALYGFIWLGCALGFIM